MVLGTRVYDAASEHSGAGYRRPDGVAPRVNDPAGSELAVLLGADLDQLFHTDRIQLRALPFQMCFFHEFFRQEPVASLGQHDEIGVDYFTFDIVRLLIAFLVETLVHEFDTRRLSRAVEYDIFGAKTGQNLNSEVFGNLAQPFGLFADRYGIVPLVDHIPEAETQ